MPTKVPTIREWWPKRVHAWANHTFTNHCKTGKQREELERLLTDNRMEAVKEILTTLPLRAKRGMPKLPNDEWVPAEYLDCFDDPLVGYLVTAWTARGYWRDMHDRLPDNRQAELEAL